MRFRLGIQKCWQLARLVTAIRNVKRVRTHSPKTFRKRINDMDDKQLRGFLDDVDLLWQVLDDLRDAPVTVEAEIVEPTAQDQSTESITA